MRRTLVLATARQGLAFLLGMFAISCSVPKPSAEIRSKAQALADIERQKGRAAIGRVQNPEAPDHLFVYDPGGLVPAALAKGQDPAHLYVLGEGSFDRVCSSVEPRWYYCLISWGSGAVDRVVVTAGRGSDSAWQQLQRDQVALSPRGGQIIAENSGHGVSLGQPEIVIRAIKSVVDATHGRTDASLCAEPSRKAGPSSNP